MLKDRTWQRSEIGSIRSPNVVPLLVLLAHHADLQPVAAYGQIATGNGHLLLAQVPVQVQVDLVLVHRAVQLGVEDHRGRADVVLARVVVVALVIGVVVVRGDRDRRGRARGPRGAVVIAGAPAARPAPRENVRVARLRGDQGQRGGRRGAVARVHGHAVGRVRVLLARVRRKNCNNFEIHLFPNPTLLPLFSRSGRIREEIERIFRKRRELVEILLALPVGNGTGSVVG